MSYLFLRVERDGAELSFFILQPTQIIFRFKSSLQIFVPRSHAQIEKNAQLLTIGVVTVQSSITSGLFAQYLKHKLITTIEKHLQVDKTLILKDRDSCLSP